MSRLRRALIGTVVLATLAAAGYWWSSRSAVGPSAGPLETVTLAASLDYPGSSLISIADAMGYFLAEDVQVTIQPHATGKASLDAVIAGQADLATVADIPFMFAAMKGSPVVVVAAMATTSGEDYAILARRDRRIGSVSGLSGKRVAVTGGTSGHFFLDAMLIRQHVASSQIKLVDLAPNRMAAALAAGAVDAVSTWEPYLGTVREALGGNAETFRAAGIYDSPWLLAARREVASSRAEAVRRVLRALLRAEQYLASEPAAARALLAGLRKEDPARVSALLAVFRFEVRLGQSLLGAFEDEARWAMRSGLVDGTTLPNFLDHLHLEGLLAVRAASVTVIH